MEMFWYGPHMGGWAVGLGSLVFWALTVAAIIALVRFLTRGGQRPYPPYQGYPGGGRTYGQPGHTASPEQLLAERFARGEIDEDEFHQRMAVLRAEAQYPGADGPGTR